MLAQKKGTLIADRYTSDRVYDGVRRVSHEEAAVNRKGVLKALKLAKSVCKPKAKHRVAG